jgi:prevent-host-death family protein
MEEATESRKAESRHEELTADEAKSRFGELLGRAGFGGERIVITRHGKPIAAFVSLRDLEALDGAA